MPRRKHNLSYSLRSTLSLPPMSYTLAPDTSLRQQEGQLGSYFEFCSFFLQISCPSACRFLARCFFRPFCQQIYSVPLWTRLTIFPDKCFSGYYRQHQRMRDSCRRDSGKKGSTQMPR